MIRRRLTPRYYLFFVCFSFTTPGISAFSSSPRTGTGRYRSVGERAGERSLLRIASEDVEQNRVQDAHKNLEMQLSEDMDHSSDAPTFDSYNELELEYENEESLVEIDEQTLNLRIQLPQRLVKPGVGWKHHHEATLRLFRGNGEEVETEQDEPEPEKTPWWQPSVKVFKQYIMRPHLVSSTAEWKRLQKHAQEIKRHICEICCKTRSAAIPSLCKKMVYTWTILVNEPLGNYGFALSAGGETRFERQDSGHGAG
ncbi:hypothetical protein MHU86_20542 [Fragilaria crotonensis]|nr:hypothetical protein MHU86_20542 [Fragilaria crotonensis]